MKKYLILAILLIILSFSGWYLYKKSIPEIAAKAIVKGEYSAVIPNQIKSKVNKVRDSINNNIETLLVQTDNAGITVEQLLEGIDQVNKKEVIITYQKILSQNITMPEEVFNIAYENIKIEAFDPIIFKDPFLKNISEAHIKRILNYAEANNIIETIGISMGKEIAKKIIIEKKDEITSRTDIIQFDSLKDKSTLKTAE